MLYWAGVFLIIGIIDEILGLAGVAGAATYFGQQYTRLTKQGGVK
jgi:uncharacterized membrane protein YtjA (UPF0391 family)